MGTNAAQSSGPSLRWAGLPILLAGACGYALGELHEATRVPADTEVWSARSGSGELLRVLPDRGLVLGPGDRLTFKARDGRPPEVEELRLKVQRAGQQSSGIRLHARDGDVGAYRLLVVPGPVLTATLSAHIPGAGEAHLGSARREVLQGDAETPFALTWRLHGPKLEVLIDGESLLQAEDARLTRGGCGVQADGIRVLALGLDSTDANGVAVPYDLDLAEWQERAAASRKDLVALVGYPAGAVALALLAMAGLLRSLCRGAPGIARTLQVALLALAPAAVLVALSPLLDQPPSPALLAASVALGAVFGLAALGRVASAPSPRARVTRPMLVAGALLIGLTAAAAAAWRWQAIAPLLEEAELACSTPGAPPWELPRPVRLDASNALVAVGPYRSLVLRGTVELEPNSWLELRLRARSAAAPQGVALFLGSDDRMTAGFVNEDDERFTPIGDGAGPLPAGRPLALEVRADRSHWEARVDGALLAEADEHHHPSGGFVALAADGAATVSALRLETSSQELPARGALGDALNAAGLWLALGLVLSILTALLLAVHWTRTPVIAGWALAAPALLLVTSGGAPPSQDAWLLGVAGGVAVLLAAAALHGRRFVGPVLPVAGGLALMAGLLLVAGKPTPTDQLKGLAADEFDLPRLSPGLVHVGHPGLRRLNDYLIDHSFRGRHFELHKPPGTVRVACLGTSTTWGYGVDESTAADYPSILEGLLNANAKAYGPRIEVMNAGVRGWTAPRMRRLFEEVVSEFEPDVVTISLYYNDSVHATVGDEEEWLMRVAQPEIEYDWIDGIRSRLESRSGSERLTRLLGRMQAEGLDTATAWAALDPPSDEPTPPERFERNLRRLVAAVQATGAKLALVKEPVRGRAPCPWRDEFYAAIDRIGAEVGAPVVDVEAALQAAGGAALFMDDIHLHARGNQQVAMQLAPVVERLIAQGPHPGP